MRKCFALFLVAVLMLAALPSLVLAEPLTDELVTYSAVIPSNTLRKRDPNEMEVNLEREARTNVRIEWTEIPATALNERKATIFASGDYPDLFVGVLNNSDVLTYGLAGALLSFNEYMTEETMPNFLQALSEVPAAAGAITMPDGGVYALPNINLFSVWPGDGVYIRTVQMINVEWLATLGLDMPTTTDELLDVLRAFRDNDPNQNGLQDEIPYSFCYNEGHANNMGETVFGPFGLIGPSHYLNVKDNKVFYAIEDPAYVEAIKFARTLYAEGLMDAEAFTQDTARMYAKGNAETPVYGLVNGWTGDVEVGAARIGIPGEGKMYEPLPPVTGPTGVTVWKNEPAGINTNRLSMSVTAENPELIARWADLLFTPDETIQEIWGVYELAVVPQEDGSWIRLTPPEGFIVDEWINYTGTRMLPAYLSSDMALRLFNTEANGVISDKTTLQKYQLASVYAPYVIDEYMPLYILSETENEEIALLNTPVLNAMKEKEVAWIMGQSDVEVEYDAVLSELYNLGLTQMVAIYQAAYDRAMGN